MTERITYIYGLRDPRDGLIHYVGKSNSPRSRLLQHIEDKDTNKRKAVWIDDLATAGLKPDLVILEAVSLSEWQQAERTWIAQGIVEGWPLTNISAGGTGAGEITPYVSPWQETIARYLMPHERPLFNALPVDKQKAICRNAALAMMYHSWTGIRMRGGDPEKEFDDHKLFWAGSRVARALVHRMAGSLHTMDCIA